MAKEKNETLFKADNADSSCVFLSEKLKGSAGGLVSVRFGDEAEKTGLDILQILGLSKLSLDAQFRPVKGSDNWILTGSVGATVTQTCVVTLNPVRTRLNEDFERRYVRNIKPSDDTMVEMDEDADVTEVLSPELSLFDIVIETVALSLPPYPRADGVDFEGALVAPSGVEPLTDQAINPFSALAGLKSKLENDET